MLGWFKVTAEAKYNTHNGYNVKWIKSKRHAWMVFNESAMRIIYLNRFKTE